MQDGINLGPSSSPEQFAYINALRGIAILGVIGTHTACWMHGPPGVFKGLLNYGLYGVQLFFLASALTLSISWHARSTSEHALLRDYWIRRFFRIAPMYYLAIAFYLHFDTRTAEFSAPTASKVIGGAFNVSFLHGLSPVYINNIVPGGWTIGVEVLFYVIFPFLITRITGMVSAGLAFVGSVGVGFAAHQIFEPWFVQHLQTKYWDSHFFYYWLPSQLPVFVAGIAVYYAINHRMITNLAMRRRKLISLILTVVSLGTLFTLRKASPSLQMPILGTCYGILAIALHLYPWGIFVNQLICRLGVLSFSVYLVHWIMLAYLTQPVEVFLEQLSHGWKFQRDIVHFGCFLALVGASGLLAWLFNAFVERPGIHVGKALVRFLRGQPT